MKKLIPILIILFLSPIAQAEEVFTDSYWEIYDAPNDYGSWDSENSEWDSETALVYLKPKGNWEIDYRPYWIEVEFSGIAELWIIIFDTNNNVIASKTISSSEKMKMGFVGYDIDRVYFISGVAFSVTNIEFFPETLGPALQSGTTILAYSAGGPIVKGSVLKPADVPPAEDYYFYINIDDDGVWKFLDDQLMKTLESP